MSLIFDDEGFEMDGERRRTRLSVRPILLVVSTLAASGTHAGEAIGRYSAERAGPTVTQRDLLAVSVSPQFPESVRTVGQAVDVTLMTTGYRLSPPLTGDPTRAVVLALPLPAAHREFRNTPVRRVLETLVGPAFKLIEDPVHRLVSFERCGGPIEPAAQAGTRP